MEEDEYQYFVVNSEPTKTEINEKALEGWELCDTPDGVIGRDLEREPNGPHSKFYFRKRIDT